ncbi:HTTM domain-containing protein [Halorubrum vacuolatum]|uniref:Vitamin K-dependent gamma-carboxylase n=1 Tax=Halorubrum vacuolatum TaxID=63740 RepID=A0A238WKC8_HALVU|nr:HTTM domain-containing protein [Halorubrum vacuolatum]SNR47036.1 Vitamin K-dependent gamma-carboxylase [Halorubrum vacuolatum]
MSGGTFIGRAARTGFRRLRRFLAGSIAVDPRSLAAFRIALGVLVIADLLARSRNFAFYYTDDGIVTQSLAERGTSNVAFSVFYYTSSTEAIAALFVLQGLIALALVLGYRTRLSTALSFLFVISLDHHNPFVLSYADTLFRLLFFWAVFMPLGDRYSIDALQARMVGGERAARAERRGSRAVVVHIAVALGMAQMVVMYFVNGLHKSTSEAWRSGEASPLVFGIDEMTFLLGNTMRNALPLIEFGGLLWFYILLASPMLFLLRGRARYLFLTLFAGGHASFAVTVRIGAFAYVALAGLLLFLQPAFWRDAGRVVRALGIDPERITRGVDARIGRPIATVLPAFGRLSQGSPRRFFRYTYLFALGAVVIALVLIAAIFLLNAGAVMGGEDEIYDQHALTSEVRAHSAGEHVHTVSRALNVRQPEWSVFAPTPRSTDRYYVFGANTTDGEHLDVFHNRSFTWERPTDELQRQHDTYRQRFFMNDIRRNTLDGDLAASYGDHLCRTYEEEYGIELVTIEMYQVTEQITRDTIDDPEGRERTRNKFYEHEC